MISTITTAVASSTHNALEVLVRIVANHLVDYPLHLVRLLQDLSANVHENEGRNGVDCDLPHEEQENDDFRVLPARNRIADGVKGAVQTEQGDEEGDHYRAEDLALERLVRVVTNLQHEFVVLSGTDTQSVKSLTLI